MTIDLVVAAYERTRNLAATSVYSTPHGILRELGNDLLEAANLTRDPALLKLALQTAMGLMVLKATLERELTSKLLHAARERSEGSEDENATQLGGIVVVDLLDLITPRSGQLQVSKAIKQFQEELGENPQLISAAVAMLQKVSHGVLQDYRSQVSSLVTSSADFCKGATLPEVLPKLDAELWKTITRWHATASEYDFEQQSSNH